MKEITTRSGRQIYYFVEKVTRGCKTQKGIVEKFVKGTDLSYHTTYYMMFDPKRLFSKGQIMKFCTVVGLNPDPSNLLVQSFKDDGRFTKKLPGYIYKAARNKKQASKQGVSMSKIRENRNPSTASGKMISKAVSEKYPNLSQKESWKKISEEKGIPVGSLNRATYPKSESGRNSKFSINTASRVADALDFDSRKKYEYLVALKGDNLLETIPDSIQPSLPFDGETKITSVEYELIKRMGAVENSVEKEDFLRSTEILIGICEDTLKGNGFTSPWLINDLNKLRKKVSTI